MSRSHPSRLVSAAAAAVLAAVAVLAAFTFAPSGPSAATGAPGDAPPESTVVVNGTANARLAPDLATLNLGVTSTKPTAAAARDDVNRRVAAVVDGLVQLGLAREDLQTGSLSLSRTRMAPTKKGGPRPVRYVASDDLTVRTRRLDLVPGVVDRATAVGVDEVSGPNLSLEDPTAAARQANRLALLDARRQADEAAAALGQRVTGVRTIDLTGGGGPVPYPEQARALSAGPADAAAPTVVEPGRLDVTTTVTVVFLIGPA